MKFPANKKSVQLKFGTVRASFVRRFRRTREHFLAVSALVFTGNGLMGWAVKSELENVKFRMTVAISNVMTHDSYKLYLMDNGCCRVSSDLNYDRVW